MFVHAKRRFKNGKEHSYGSVVENHRNLDGRVAQRQVLHLDEINDSQRPVCKQRTPEIRYPVGSGFGHGPEKRYPAGSESMRTQHPMDVESTQRFHPDLSWSYYRALMRVENEEARQFHEQEDQGLDDARKADITYSEMVAEGPEWTLTERETHCLLSHADRGCQYTSYAVWQTLPRGRRRALHGIHRRRLR